MTKLLQPGRYLFAIGVAGIGMEHFIYGDFMLGRAPAWPEAWPGKILWAYLTGIVFIISALTIFIDKKVRTAMAVTASLLLAWALIRHIPVVAADMLLGGAWTAAGKALVFIGGALAIASGFQRINGRGLIANLFNRDKEFIVFARVCLGIFMVICGIQHFMFIQFVATLMPTWFPGDPVFWSYVGGILLIAGGVGLFIPRTAPMAAMLSGVMIFSWVWIIHMPRIMLSISDNVAVFEALAFSGIAFVITQYPSSNNSVAPKRQ